MIGARPTSRSTTTPTLQSPGPPLKVTCYPSELQLQYSSVLSKTPAAQSAAASLLRDIVNPLKEGGGARSVEEVGTSPRFYNIRTHYVPCDREGEGDEGEEGIEDEGELRVEAKVDEQVSWCGGAFIISRCGV